MNLQADQWMPAHGSATTQWSGVDIAVTSEHGRKQWLCVLVALLVHAGLLLALSRWLPPQQWTLVSQQVFDVQLQTQVQSLAPQTPLAEQSVKATATTPLREEDLTTSMPASNGVAPEPTEVESQQASPASLPVTATPTGSKPPRPILRSAILYSGINAALESDQEMPTEAYVPRSYEGMAPVAPQRAFAVAQTTFAPYFPVSSYQSTIVSDDVEDGASGNVKVLVRRDGKLKHCEQRLELLFDMPLSHIPYACKR